jgi:hypothetical protein
MDMKKNVVKSDTANLASQLAPPEEQAKHSAAAQPGSSPNSNTGHADGEFAAIVVDADDVNLSRDIVERRAETTFLGMEPVVLVILGIMLTFIAFIAWQISKMPVE